MAGPASVVIDCGTNLHSYSRDMAFGANVLGEWDDRQLYIDNAWRLKQAGINLLRFPGGTNANEYHWNGSGHYDARHIWHNMGSPRVERFVPGFYDLATYRGSTVPGNGQPGKVTDGRADTCWLSYPKEEGPQWVYLDIRKAGDHAVAVSRAIIDWGVPFARRFKIQYSNGNTERVNEYCYNDTAWVDVVAKTLTGTGGRSEIAFPTVNAKYVRICCLTSSSSDNQYAINEIRLYNGNVQITKNEDDGAQTPSVSSSVNIGDTYYGPSKIDFEQFMEIVHSMGPNAQPIIGVNLFTGTPEEAADWVYYANIKRGFHIKYWEVGNEVSANWEAGGPIGATSYARRFEAFYDAMKAMDSSIIVIPEFSHVMDVENVTMDSLSCNPTDRQYYIENFLKYLQKHGRGDMIEAVSVHEYPVFQPKSEQTALEKVNQWDGMLPLLKHWIAESCRNPARVQIYLTEYNDGIDSIFTEHFYDSLFISAYLLDFLENGGDAGCFFTTFGTPNEPRPDGTSMSDFGMLEGGQLNNNARNLRCQPRASFYALEMLHNDFSADDSVGNSLVSTSSSDGTLKVYANKRGDHKLSLLLVNMDPKNPSTVNITLKGFNPRHSADIVSYGRKNYSWGTRAGQSYASPDDPPDIGKIDTVKTAFPVEMEPYSMKVITLSETSPYISSSAP